MSSLAVDTIKTKVTIMLADGSNQSGHIFLSPFDELGVGKQSVYGMLTAEKAFIPFESQNGDFSFLNQDAIVWLSHQEFAEEEASEITVPVETKAVTVHLSTGKVLSGEVSLEMPEGRMRLSDWLNDCVGWLVIRSGDKEILINLFYVLRVA